MRVRVLAADLRLRRPVAAADVLHDRRRSIFLELREPLFTGVAELPLATTPGTQVTEGEVLDALGPLLASGQPPEDGGIGAAAALQLLEAASLDLALRRRGRSLASVLGVTREDVGFAGVVGICEPDESVRRATELVAAGATRVRVKVAPSTGFAALRAVLSELPVPVVADANGAFGAATAASLDELAEVPIAWLEQPFASFEGPELERLASRGITLGADESVDSPDALGDLLEGGLVGVVCVKPSRLGIAGALEAIELARRMGAAPYVGGYFETGLARAVLGALSAKADGLDGDVVAPVTYLEHDPCGLAGPRNGRQPLHHAPGIGPPPHPDALVTLVELDDVPEDRFATTS